MEMITQSQLVIGQLFRMVRGLYILKIIQGTLQ